MINFRIANITLIFGLIASIGLLLKGFEYWWLLLIVCLFAYLVIVLLGVVNVKWQFFMPITCRFPNNENSIILSFDDGPHEKTSAILDLLKKHHATGNFFCVGKHLNANPQLAQRMVEEGHFIGNHSYSHTIGFPTKSERSIIEELKNTNTIIEKYTAKPCRFFRPPFGVSNPTIAQAVLKLNMISVGWSIRTLDTKDKVGTKALNKIKKNLKSGDIILLHDHSPQIIYILEQLLYFLKKNNFKTQQIDTIWKQK